MDEENEDNIIPFPTSELMSQEDTQQDLGPGVPTGEYLDKLVSESAPERQDNVIPFDRRSPQAFVPYAPSGSVKMEGPGRGRVAVPAQSREPANIGPAEPQTSATSATEEPDMQVAQRWNDIAAGAGNRFQSAPESYLDPATGNVDEGKFYADLANSGEDTGGAVAEYGKQALRKGFEAKLNRPTKFDSLTDEQLKSVLENMKKNPGQYSEEVKEDAMDAFTARKIKRAAQAPQTAEQTEVQAPPQPVDTGSSDPTKAIPPGVEGHEDADGSIGHDIWLSAGDQAALQAQRDAERRQALETMSTSEPDPSELQRQREQEEYEKRDREHPWLNFFLGPNKDEQWAEDHGWKYHNNIEHGWVMPNQQSFRTAMANTEKWTPTPEEQRFAQDQAGKKQAAAESLRQNTQNTMMRASSANSMLSTLNKAVANGAYDTNSQAFQQSMQNILDLANSFPDDGGIGTQTKNLIVSYANLANRDYQTRVNFDLKGLQKITQVNGTFDQLGNDLKNHYDARTGTWYNDKGQPNESYGMAWYSAIDSAVDRVEQIMTNAGATMADAAKIRAWHKFVDKTGFLKAKTAITNYVNTLNAILGRITDPSSKQRAKEAIQQSNVLKALLNAGKTKDDKGWENKVRGILDQLMDTGFGLTMADFGGMSKEDYDAAIGGLKNEYDAYQQALLFSGGLDNNAVMNALAEAGNMGVRSYNKSAVHVGAKPYKGYMSWTQNAPANPRNYVSDVNIKQGIGDYDAETQQGMR